MRMLKGYVAKWERVLENGKQPRIDYRFNSKIENAAYWQTREDAENDCLFFERSRIVISSNEGGVHVCKNFRVEERASTEFVIYCEAPFRSEAALGEGPYGAI